MPYSIPRMVVSVLVFAGFLVLAGCGNDDYGYYYGSRGVAYRPYRTYTYTYVPPPMIVPIQPRTYLYRNSYRYNSYPNWQSRYALQSYIDCRTYGRMRYVRVRRYNCSFADYGYEAAARQLDYAVEQFWAGNREEGESYVSEALKALPASDPIARQLEEVQSASAETSDLSERTVNVLEKIAQNMVPAS